MQLGEIANFIQSNHLTKFYKTVMKVICLSNHPLPKKNQAYAKTLFFFAYILYISYKTFVKSEKKVSIHYALELKTFHLGSTDNRRKPKTLGCFQQFNENIENCSEDFR